MATKYLSQDQLQAFLGFLAESAKVIAPIKNDGVVSFTPWTAGTEVELDVLLARQSPKEFIFRQSETYLTYTYTAEGPAEAVAGTGQPASEEEPSDNGKSTVIGREKVHVQPVNEAPAQVIFGLRPCDARGFVQMDNVFSGYGGFYFDPYYNAKRQATTLLAVTCRDPRSTCFCTTVGGGPAATDGVDALFTQVEGGFVAEAFTEKGEAALAFGGMKDAQSGQETEAAGVKSSAIERIDKPFDLEGIQDNLRANFESPLWHDLAMRCVSCGTCTYVCPNCYCFNITDHTVESAGERVRTWDSCFNPSYTLETSGHNPRDPKPNRFRNRFGHKFWYYPEKYDSLLCSGCGRCIANCPVRIDIREVLRTIGSPQPVVASGEEA